MKGARTTYHRLISGARRFSPHGTPLGWRTVVHASSCVHHVYVLVYTCNTEIEHHENPHFRNLYTYKVAFLTGWNMLFQGIFLGLSLWFDLLEWRGTHREGRGEKIRYWRDVLYGGLVVPFTLFVTGIFWGVYSIDRELIFPKFYEEVIPWWLSFCVHANIDVILVLETLLQERRQPTNYGLEILLCFFFSTGYTVVIYSIYYFGGMWLYQFFKVMSLWQICLYQVGCWMASYIFYSIQFPINRLVHGSEIDQRQKGE